MTLKLATNALRRPVRPKVVDEATERALREHDDKINELQDLMRLLAGKVP